MSTHVIAVHLNPQHTFSKAPVKEVQLRSGLGVEGDTHFGPTVQHLSRKRKDPAQQNLRQVHLIHAELFVELQLKGFTVQPGELGENITTQGIDLLALPTGTVLKLGADAEIKITGLRNPCKQINDFQAGLMNALLDRDEAGNLIRKAGVMAVVLKDGVVKAGDAIQVEWPEAPYRPLMPV